jgi:amyloid beta precursor protein binding protein 1
VHQLQTRQTTLRLKISCMLAGPELHAILEDKSTEVNASSPDFWVMVAALKLYIAKEGQGEPPLDGAIPDMHSFTE